MVSNHDCIAVCYEISFEVGVKGRASEEKKRRGDASNDRAIVLEALFAQSSRLAPDRTSRP